MGTVTIIFMSPTTEVDPVVEIPVLARISKLPADPRLTAAGLAASAESGPTRPSTQEIASANAIELLSRLFLEF